MAKKKAEATAPVIATVSPEGIEWEQVATSKKEKTDAERKVREDTERREKRGKSIAAMKLVTKVGNHYEVSTPTLRGKSGAPAIVSKDELGYIVCTCEEFHVGRVADPTFKCEHRWAVFWAVKEQQFTTREPEPTLDEQFATAVEKEEIKEEVKVMAKPQEVDAPQVNHVVKQEEFVKGHGAQYKSLTAPIPRNLVKQREGHWDRNANKRVMLDYVEWHTVVDRLNTVFGLYWTMETVWLNGTAFPVCNVTIGIVLEDGSVVKRTGVGVGRDWDELGVKTAESDGIKRAAVKFGVAIELYHKEELESYVSETKGAQTQLTQTSQQNYPNAPANGEQSGEFNPIARSLSDLVTAKQLGMIRAISREIGVDPGNYCKTKYNCRTDELSRKAASNLIGMLQDDQNS